MNEAMGYGTDWALVPEPVLVREDGGMVTMPCVGRIGLAETLAHGTASNGIAAGTSVDPLTLAQQLAEDIASTVGFDWDIAAGAGWRSQIELSLDDALDAQAYRLDIDGTASDSDVASPSDGLRVRVAGGDPDGVRNGVQTLRQIIRQCAPALPVVHIEDHPDFATRGYYLDVTRGRVPTLDWLKTWADRLCLLKYNQLQLYVEHSMMFEGLAETWRGASPLTARDIMEFDAYCARLGIELVPSVSTFGHHYMALRTHSLRDLGELPGDAERPYSLIERMEHHTLNITDERAFDFSIKLIDETMGLFRSRKFNICADETFDLGKGASKPLADRVGVPRMYADYVTRLCRHVAERGHEPMMWGDIAIESTEILPQLPKDVRLLNWNYAPDCDDTGAALVAAAGARQIVCLAVLGWNTLLGRTHDAWRNISRMARFGVRHGAEGILVTDWGDFGHINDPRSVTPAMAYGAHCAWRAGDGTEPSEEADAAREAKVGRAISMAVYGDRTGDLVAALRHFEKASWFPWEQLVRYLELDDGRGGVNLDVLGTVSWDAGELKADLAAAGEANDLMGARTAFLRKILAQVGPDAPAKAKAKLAEGSHALAVLMPGLDAPMRAEVGQTFLLSIEGQRLLNALGECLLARHGVVTTATTTTKDEVSEPSPGERFALADAIDRWFETYAAVWRTVSRESELRRIADLVWKATDLLRS